MNAANEIAVQAFLDGKIRLNEISEIIQSVMKQHETKPVINLEVVREVDQWARIKAVGELESRKLCSL
jgi:1-deoxy-D-xylulose-5-phosphate reductoisomerase